jgi:glutathione reductase (NADPH)
MPRQADVLIIGSGTAGHTAAHALRKAGRDVLVVDKQPFGGVCAMRGCQPKKILVAAAQAVHGVQALARQGVRGDSRLDWTELMGFKRAFTDAVPAGTEKGFQKAGMHTMHGRAAFMGPQLVRVAQEEFTARQVLIASGAVPKRLDIPGRELLMDSDGFLEMDVLPESIAFLGGGFICFEFAFVCALAGARTTIIHRSGEFLRRFDPDMVAVLMQAGRDLGINFLQDTSVGRVEKNGSGVSLHLKGKRKDALSVDAAVAAVGRVPDLDDLHLEAGEVEYSSQGVVVNAFMQSVTNPAVYAVGDAAATPFALATTADMEAEVAAHNMVHGNSREADHVAVPSVAFSIPPLAGVGLSEEQAEKQGLDIVVNTDDATRWMSSRRIGQKHAAYKVILDKTTGRVLGAHLVGHGADEMINIFALAVKFNLTRTQLKSLLWAYPTHVSDIKYML